MLFLLVMDPLQRMLELATERGVLSPLQHVARRMRVSLYADDAALFVNPIRGDIVAIWEILCCFGKASGLHVNLTKCVAYPIRCEGLNIQDILAPFGGGLGELPCKYLGLPLNVRKPRRVAIQPLLDKMAAKLQKWKEKMLSRAGRLVLVNSVLTSTTTFFLSMFPASSWAIKRMDKLRRNFSVMGRRMRLGDNAWSLGRKSVHPRDLAVSGSRIWLPSLVLSGFVGCGCVGNLRTGLGKELCCHVLKLIGLSSRLAL